MLLKTKLKSSDNLSLFRYLAVCPALAASTTLFRALGLSIVMLVSLTISEVLASLLRKLVPAGLRVPVYLLLTSFSVTAVWLILQAVLPAMTVSLGIYIPVTAVSCWGLMRVETFAAENTPVAAAWDGLISGGQFSTVMLIWGLVRELFGTGRLFAGFAVNGVKIFPAAPVSFLATPAGALLLAACGAALINYVEARNHGEYESTLERSSKEDWA